MNETMMKRRKYVEELMKVYKECCTENLKDVQSVFEREQGFREYMKEKISVSSFQKGLNDFINETKRIEINIANEKRKFNELLNEFSLRDNEFSTALLTNTRKNIFDKNLVDKELSKLLEEFNNTYDVFIDDYNKKLDNLFENIQKMVDLNRKFVIEYGGLQITDTPIENEYKPIYDIHDQIYENFIYELKTMAYRMNFLPQEIKSTYSRTSKLLEKSYDLFSDLLNDLNNN